MRYGSWRTGTWGQINMQIYSGTQLFFVPGDKATITEEQIEEK